MKKFGFTLPEILITLGVIGVVAALTTPALVMNSRKEANGARLAVAVSNLENAFTTAIVQEGVDDIFKTAMWKDAPISSSSGADKKNAFVGNMNKYIFASTRANGYTVYAMAETGNKGEAFSMGSPLGADMKNGATLFITTNTEANGGSITEDVAIARGTAYRTKAAEVYIDVNGPAAPNTVGRDVFAFQLGQNGILYPYGGHDFVVHAAADGKDYTVSDSTYECTDSKIADSGRGCTARLIADNYKMNY